MGAGAALRRGLVCARARAHRGLGDPGQVADKDSEAGALAALGVILQAAIPRPVQGSSPRCSVQEDSPPRTASDDGDLPETTSLRTFRNR